MPYVHRPHSSSSCVFGGQKQNKENNKKSSRWPANVTEHDKSRTHVAPEFAFRASTQRYDNAVHYCFCTCIVLTVTHRDTLTARHRLSSSSLLLYRFLFFLYNFHCFVPCPYPREHADRETVLPRCCVYANVHLRTVWKPTALPRTFFVFRMFGIIVSKSNVRSLRMCIILIVHVRLIATD
jgi:hypothetical protein